MATKTVIKEQTRRGYIARESFSSPSGDFVGNNTRVSQEWLDEHPQLAHMFKPMTFHYDVEAATAVPGETRA